MKVFELIVPGYIIKNEKREKSRKHEGLLRYLETSFYDANVALNLFEYERAHQSINNETPEQNQQYHQRWHALEKQVREEFGLGPYDKLELVMYEVEKRLKIERWKNGEIPTDHKHRLIFLYAKNFLYALDTFDKFLKVLAEDGDAPEIIKEYYGQFTEEFPDLREVRNSSQHLEDRARGFGRRDPKGGHELLNLKPVDNGIIFAPQGALVMEALCGSEYGCTMVDGHYGQVDISAESMSKIQAILQNVFNSFEWEGSRKHLPS